MTHVPSENGEGLLIRIKEERDTFPEISQMHGEIASLGKLSNF